MKSPIPRPARIRLLALARFWFCLGGTLTFPVLVLKGAFFQLAEAILEPHFHSNALSIVVAIVIALVWFMLCVGFGLIGIGLWTLRPWGLRAEIRSQKVFLVIAVVGVIVGCYWNVLLSLGIGVWCVGGLWATLWYLNLPSIQWAFAAQEAYRNGNPIPYPPAPKSPSQRRKEIGIGIAAGVCVVAIFAFTLFHFVDKGFRTSVVYQSALQQANASPCVQRDLGAPIVAKGSMASGEISESADTGSATMSIPVRGSKGEGSISLRATKANGSWTFQDLNVYTGSSRIYLQPTASGCN